MPNALVPLASFVLASAQASVVFSGIPQSGFKDLRLVCDATPASGEGQFVLYINSDSGSNYSYVSMYAFGSGSAGSTATTNSALLTNFQTGLAAGGRGMVIYELIDAQSTDKHKTILYRSNHSAEVDAIAGRWANTAAISSLTVTMGGVSFAAGSTFNLYGIL